MTVSQFADLLTTARQTFGGNVHVERLPSREATTLRFDGGTITISDDQVRGLTAAQQMEFLRHAYNEFRGGSGLSGITIGGGTLSWPPPQESQRSQLSDEQRRKLQALMGGRQTPPKPQNQSLTEETAQALIKAVADMSAELSALRVQVERLQEPAGFTRLADAYADD